jgi:hypothetical protein
MEKIVNIYVVIKNGFVVNLFAKDYTKDGEDQEKVQFLFENAENDFPTALEYGAAVNKNGEFLSYKQFNKLEKRGMHFQMFQHIFEELEMGNSPLICVTPIVDGKILSKK